MAPDPALDPEQAPTRSTRRQAPPRDLVAPRGETSSPFHQRKVDPLAAAELGRACGLGPTVGQVLLHRGLTDPASALDFLEPTLRGLSPPDAMVDRQAASERIASAIRGRERIAIFGDYDVDGTTAAVILADTLEAMGGDVIPLIGERFSGGYGLSKEALDKVRAVRPGLLVTCDCGSSDHDRIADAKRQGLDVIVVDHHLVPEEPLPALAFLNPQRPDCRFRYKGMASAGLVFSLAAGVRRALGHTLDLRPWLDLVALGTVADVAPLDGDNRRLVRAGLGVLMESPRPGLRALFELISVRSPIGGADISMRIAPRLNAPGRLGDPRATVALLRTHHADAARQLAAQMEALNTERKALERRVTEEAMADVEAQRARRGGELPPGLVVAKEGWHRGVVGITAARLVDRYARPVLVISLEGAVGHGSGRTPAGTSIYDVLSRCKGSLQRFGGHAAAVGCTIDARAVGELREAFEHATGVLAASKAATIERPVDVIVDGSAFPVPSPRDLWRLEPVGMGNPEPLFALVDAPICHARAVGSRGEHLKLTLRCGGRDIPAFAYDRGGDLPALGPALTARGHFRFDHYRGGRSVEFRLQESRLLSSS